MGITWPTDFLIGTKPKLKSDFERGMRRGLPTEKVTGREMDRRRLVWMVTVAFGVADFVDKYSSQAASYLARSLRSSVDRNFE